MNSYQYDIIPKFGLPREYCSCPGCGQVYGHHRTKVCNHCGECSKCCKDRPEENACGKNQEFVEPLTFVQENS